MKIVEALESYMEIIKGERYYVLNVMPGAATGKLVYELKGSEGVYYTTRFKDAYPEEVLSFHLGKEQSEEIV